MPGTGLNTLLEFFNLALTQNKIQPYIPFMWYYISEYLQMRERGSGAAEHQDRPAPKYRPGVRSPDLCFLILVCFTHTGSAVAASWIVQEAGQSPTAPSPLLHPHSSCNPWFKVCMQIQRRFRGERAGENRVQGLVGEGRGSLKGQRAAVIRT